MGGTCTALCPVWTECFPSVIMRCCTGALSCIFHVAGIDLNWLYLLMGILIGPAVPPVTFCLIWCVCPLSVALPMHRCPVLHFQCGGH